MLKVEGIPGRHPERVKRDREDQTREVALVLSPPRAHFDFSSLPFYGLLRRLLKTLQTEWKALKALFLKFNILFFLKKKRYVYSDTVKVSEVDSRCLRLNCFLFHHSVYSVNFLWLRRASNHFRLCPAQPKISNIKAPRASPGGSMMKFRIDWYITMLSNVFYWCKTCKFTGFPSQGTDYLEFNPNEGDNDCKIPKCADHFSRGRRKGILMSLTI